LQLRWFIVFATETREQWVVEFVASAFRADQQSLIDQARKVFSLEFAGELVSSKLACTQPRTPMNEVEFLDAQLRNVRPEFFVS